MDISQQVVDQNIILVHLSGRLDAVTTPKVKAVFQQLTAKEQPKIIVDLKEVSFIDSSGLAALVSGLKLAREKEGTIVLSSVQPQARTVFHLTMMDRVFSIHPTPDEARRSLI